MRKNHLGRYQLLYLLTTLTCLQSTLADIKIGEHDLTLKLNEIEDVEITATDLPHKKVKLTFVIQHTDIVNVDPTSFYLNGEGNVTLKVKALGAGHSDVYASCSEPSINVDDIFLRVTVYKKSALDTVSAIIGWIYFVAWSVSFYPQMYTNWKRKSVVGLNFDFLSLNLIGFTLYSTFNLGLYFIEEVKTEYFERYPRGQNPVKVNDIFFAVHAVITTLITCVQCFIYEREEQRVSLIARCIMGVFAAFISIIIILAACNVIIWLDFLYYCSYVKLTITLIKYVPQAYMNFKRKSTIGWSIVNIFLDFTGGSLSMLQMILDAYNYDDWDSIFGDPTKFGLGLFSVAFDIFFIIQHYVLYKHSNLAKS